MVSFSVIQVGREVFIGVVGVTRITMRSDSRYHALDSSGDELRRRGDPAIPANHVAAIYAHAVIASGSKGWVEDHDEIRSLSAGRQH